MECSSRNWMRFWRGSWRRTVTPVWKWGLHQCAPKSSSELLELKLYSVSVPLFSSGTLYYVFCSIWVLKVLSLCMCRWEGKENQGTYLGGSEEVQVSRERRWTLRRESQQQGTLRYCSGWVSPLQAPRWTCRTQV